MRELKTTIINNTVYLYPYPVLKDQKYLIRCSSQDEAALLISKITNHTIIHPDEPENSFKPVAIHNDNQTVILEFIS